MKGFLRKWNEISLIKRIVCGLAMGAVLALLLLAGWNDTCYYPSLTDMQSSLAITNSSSSLFTLKVMSVVSLLIPFVAAYIWYAWRALTRPISEREVEEAEHKY